MARPKLVFWLCFAVAMVDGFDTLVVSFTAPAFADEWQLSGSVVGGIFGLGLLGAALGGVIAGLIADRIGRKGALLSCVALFTAFTALCALAPNAGMLGLLRFVAGLGLGGAVPAITALTAETLPAERRTTVVTRMFLGFPVGAIVGGAICAAIVGPLGWRSAFWLGCFPGLALLPLLWCHVGETIATSPSAQSPAGAKRARPLGEGRSLSGMALWLAAFFILLVSYFLINWTPTILAESGLPEHYAIMGGVMLNLGGVAGAIILTFVLDRGGPFRLAGMTLLFGALLVFLLGAQLDNPGVLAPLVFAVGMAVIGGQLTLPALASNVFPASVRATGVGFTMGIGRLGSIIGPFCGGLLIDARLGWGALFLLVAVPTAFAGLLVMVCGARLPSRA